MSPYNKGEIMRYLIIVFIIFVCLPVLAEMPSLDGYLVSKTSEPISIVVNYLQKKSSNYVMLEIQKFNYDITVSSVAKNYWIAFTIRLPLAKQSIRTEIKNKCIWLKNNYGSVIDSGSFSLHRCYNDATPGLSEPCTTTLLWSK